MRTSKFSDLPKYRIKGKTYYLVENLPLSDDERDFITYIWKMTNVKGDNLKLVVRHGSKSSSYVMYDEKGNRLFSTYSITCMN